MLPDDGESTARHAGEAYALHCELRGIYDALEPHLAAGHWAAAAALMPRLGAIETALRPLATARQAVSHAEVASWASADALALELAARQTAALRLAQAARDAVAAQLVDLYASRTSAARYHDETRPRPLFASRQA